MTYGSPFAGATVKIHRGRQHLADLRRAEHEFALREGTQFLLPGGPVQDGKFNVTYMTQNLMPLEFATVVGDSVHNIRTAFDYCAVALTKPPLGSGDGIRAAFPTGENPERFQSFLRTIMHDASVSARLMLERLQPYPGGKYLLRELHELDLADKHNLLIPSISKLKVYKLDVSIGGHRVALGPQDFLSQDGRVFNATVSVPPGASGDVKLDGQFGMNFEIAFGPGQPLQGRPVFETLSQISETASRFVEECESLHRNPTTD
ncbi:hypothetical protein [Mesorhizobium sp. M1252]|uniref:hypothetical protein n=1 Tax=Mesorhizobium sp. M1252 TaxID=2957073 RepID=UPI00333CC9EF